MSGDYKLMLPRRELRLRAQHQVFASPFICPRALGVAGTLLIVADDPEVIEKPDMENSPSVVIMEYLTKRCLDFEVKFGKYPGRYG